MFVVISYDIPDDKRRLKVMKALEGAGAHAQYSVFECRLSRQDLERLKRRLKDLIEEKEDDVRLYLLCEQCVNRIVPLGRARIAPEEHFRIV